jgi:hypothetical protein
MAKSKKFKKFQKRNDQDFSRQRKNVKKRRIERKEKKNDRDIEI